MCSQSIWVQKLAVEAAVHGDVSLLKQAALMDPLTGAVCNPPEIWQMIDEMLVAQEEWLPQYKEGIEAAKTNLKEHYVTPRCEGYKGCLLYTSFVKNNKGYGSALVVWCVILIAIITAVQFIGQKKWVTYDV